MYAMRGYKINGNKTQILGSMILVSINKEITLITKCCCEGQNSQVTIIAF